LKNDRKNPLSPPPEPIDTADAVACTTALPTWAVRDLTKGGREARILHAGSLYLLRITSNDKLILTK
jgi:hemin uptake protein HemP